MNRISLAMVPRRIAGQQLPGMNRIRKRGRVAYDQIGRIG
jgi:hypothetical protein